MITIRNRFFVTTAIFIIANTVVPMATHDLPFILVGIVASGLCFVLAMTTWVLSPSRDETDSHAG